MDEAIEIALKDDVAKIFEYLTEAYISKHNKKYRNLETER